MADVVQEVIYNEGVPYLTEETIGYILYIAEKYIGKIENWIVQANKFINAKGREEWSRTNVFTNSEGNVAKGINWAGNNTRQSLRNQLIGHSKNIQNSTRRQFKDNYDMERLLKEGYKILTQFGEDVRRDKIRYRLYVYSGNADLGINDVQEFDLSLQQFLKSGTIITPQGVLKVASKTQLNNAFNEKHGKLSDLSFDLDQLNTFIDELKGYFLFAGRAKNHLLKPEGEELENQVKTINLGHVFETALNYPDVFIQFKDLTADIKNSLDWVQVTEAEKYWESFNENAPPAIKSIELNIHKISRIFQTLQDPSPFWQGGEGDNLANIQVKVGQANVTNLSTLVRQMLRVRSIIKGISRVDVQGHIIKRIANKQYEERIVAGLLRMFDRQFTGKNYIWNINY